MADPHAHDPFEIRSVEVAGCAPRFGQGDYPEMRTGKVYRSVVTSGARLTGLPAALSPGGPFAAEDYGFDLWSAVEKYRLPANSSVMVSISIESDRDGSVVLGIGCSDEFYLLEADRVVFACEGSRGYVRCQNLVPVRVHRGHNTVRLICHKAYDWGEVPANHYAPEWTLGLDLFPNDAAALRKHNSHDLHVLATPVVPTFTDLRLVSALDGHNRVTLESPQGKTLARGVADYFGRITWDGSLPGHRPFVGAIRQERRSEPFLVCEASQVAAFAKDAFRAAHADSAANPWWVRASILSAAHEYDQYWTYRQLLQTLAGGVFDSPGSDSGGMLADYPLRRLSYYSYRSHLDGTTQYFRMWRPADAGQAPIVVVLPPVNDPVRPFLRSTTVANVVGNEDLVSLASARGCVMVWPGYIESDFGGPLSELELAEALDAVHQTLPPGPHRLFLVGVCSSGIAALRYAERHGADGVALISPLIERQERRFLPGIGLDDLILPDDLPIEDSSPPDLSAFRHIPVFIDYSTIMTRHGDPVAARTFAKALRAAGGDVVEDFPRPATWFTWGERDRVFMESAFAWIDRQLARDRPAAPRLISKPAPPQSVKDALLAGFDVQPTADAPLSAWLSAWRERWSEFRGAPWSYAGAANPESTVVSRVIGRTERQEITAGSYFHGRLYGRNDELMPQLAKLPLFGIRLTRSPAGATIDLFRTTDATDNLPRIDPVVDGEFSGILWGQVEGEWLLLGVWR